MNRNGLVKNGFTLKSICRYICSDILTHNTRWANRPPWWTPAWRPAVRHFENEKSSVTISYFFGNESLIYWLSCPCEYLWIDLMFTDWFSINDNFEITKISILILIHEISLFSSFRIESKVFRNKPKIDQES